MRQGFRSLGEGAATTADCPTPEAIWEASHGEADEETLERLVEHTSSCAACAEEWRLAHGIERLTESERSAARLPSPRGWIAAAASVAIALAAGAYLLQSRTERAGSVTRNPTTTEIESLVPEDDAQARESIVLRWTAGPEGTRYGVRVVTENAEEIAAVDGLESNEYRVSPEALRDLEPGVKLLWRVVAAYPDGSGTRSRTFVTTIR